LRCAAPNLRYIHKTTTTAYFLWTKSMFALPQRKFALPQRKFALYFCKFAGRLVTE
jgi:hypothetical protein